MKRRLYADFQTVYVKRLAMMGIVVNYRRGHKFPYVVDTAKGLVYASHRGLRSADSPISSNKKEKSTSMGNIRQAIKSLTLSKEAKLFQKYDITDDKGNLTDLGRRVLMDKMFEDKSLRDALVSDIEAVEAAEAKKTK